jgi:hypothetical protein
MKIIKCYERKRREEKTGKASHVQWYMLLKCPYYPQQFTDSCNLYQNTNNILVRTRKKL